MLALDSLKERGNLEGKSHGFQKRDVGALLQKFDLNSALQSPYARAKYKVKGKVKHVLVCGHITASKARDFCQEFFHEDHGMSDAHIVFLCPELPDGQMEMLAHSRSHQITYLQVWYPRALDTSRNSSQSAACVASTSRRNSRARCVRMGASMHAFAGLKRRDSASFDAAKRLSKRRGNDL